MSGVKDGVTLEQSIGKALSSIAQSTRTLGPQASSSSLSSKPVPPIPDGLRSILGTLLQAVRHSTTALALAFKPPVTAAAAIQQLDKVSDEYARMISCVVGCGSHGSYSALVDEWREAVESVGEELGRLIEILRDGSTVSSSKGDEAYLAHTGMVWEAIDRAGDLSWTEVEAVQKRLKSQRAIVSDAWTEFKEFLEEQEEEDSEEDSGEEDGLDGEEDDEWGDLEKALGGGSMTKEERSRANAAKTILGLHQVLHASLPRFITSSSETSPNYRQFLETSSAIVASFDTVIGAMYPKQDEKEIQKTLDDLETKSRKAINAVEGVLSDEAGGEQREKLAGFSRNWETRLAAEKRNWEENRRLSLASLHDALP